MNKIPVSVAIITQNEEVNIRDALESVQDFEDIIIVDAFSNDKTPDICKEYNCRVYQLEWLGYARQKQIAVDYAENKWVLILDADERVTPVLRRELEARIKGDAFRGFFRKMDKIQRLVA
jgi:glycosyltransferase involved in cell wall biosynthesis